MHIWHNPKKVSSCRLHELKERRRDTNCYTSVSGISDKCYIAILKLTDSGSIKSGTVSGNCHHDITRRQVADSGDGLDMYSIAVNKLNK